MADKKLKIVFLTSFGDTGGASMAALRIAKAVEAQGMDVHFLVQHQNKPHPKMQVVKGWKIRLAMEKLHFLWYEKDAAHRFAFSSATVGADLANHPLIQSADIIHIHWTNQGFLSMKGMKKLFLLQKPIVWTLHDIWAFSGGCHYADRCDGYLKECGCCPLLRNPHSHDLSHQQWKKKREIYPLNHPHLIGVSDWIVAQGKSAALAPLLHFDRIFNPIDTTLFQPSDQEDRLKKKWGLPLHQPLLLFGAANLLDPRKGFKDVCKAIEQLIAQGIKPPHLVFFGKCTQLDTLTALPFEYSYLGLISAQEDMRELYQIGDGFITAALHENLSYMILEAMACETPVITYRTGGNPEAVLHKENGYVADYQSVEDLAKGILWLTQEADLVCIKKEARGHILENFNEQIVGKEYVEKYNQALSIKKSL
ncbi:glycosyltransferase [Persicobacter psychrovividus]|uniref:Glycosyl transferase n=1 Tax=Persicobacter psychrovividus TaxID=387638 RepID=A0ABM7VA95_9BACT|nr:glycosyl transferase [Persicobacter psychrovividus]